MSDLQPTPAMVEPHRGEVRATPEYPYGSWRGLSPAERAEVMFATGYHPGTGAVLAPEGTGTCGRCVYKGVEVVGIDHPRNQYLCRRRGPQRDTPIRLKWPACRLFVEELRGEALKRQ